MKKMHNKQKTDQEIETEKPKNQEATERKSINIPAFQNKYVSAFQNKHISGFKTFFLLKHVDQRPHPAEIFAGSKEDPSTSEAIFPMTGISSMRALVASLANATKYSEAAFCSQESMKSCTGS